MTELTLAEEMELISTDPKDYGLDHDAFRPHQLEAVQWILNSNKKYLILRASTGAGKSAVSSAVGSRIKVAALCKTKSLQKYNYEKTYDFEIMFGKSNYRCVHPEHPGTMADTCVFRDSGMYKCPVASQCPYLIQKDKVMQSQKSSFNYAYWLSARWVRKLNPGILFLDEAHQLSEIVLDWAGITITNKHIAKWQLPRLPQILGGNVPSSLGTQQPHERALEWLVEAAQSLDKYIKLLDAQGDDDSRKKARTGEYLGSKISATMRALQAQPLDWYIKSSKDQLQCRPLTSRYHFSMYFNAPKIVLMSATLGDIDAFAEELGIPPDQMDVMDIPSRWPPETRPIYDLGAPRMGRASKPQDYIKQAKVIADAIKQCPESWSGIIHLTKKTDATKLAKKLSMFGLRDRIWVPAYGDSTNVQLKKWNEFKRFKKRAQGLGAIGITWAFFEGVDLTEERICIAAKTPFPYLGSDFERARMKYSNTQYQWRTANQLTQALGRTRRGEEEDYDLNGRREQLVGIADGNWTRVRKHIDDEILEAIKEF